MSKHISEEELHEADLVMNRCLELAHLSYGWQNAVREGMKYGIDSWKEPDNSSVTIDQNLSSILCHIADYRNQIKEGVDNPVCYDTGRCPLENALCRLMMMKARHKLGIRK